MNKSFKEKQRENILIKLISKYEQKIKEEDKQIDELNEKNKFRKNVIYALKFNQIYWLLVIGFNLILFPIIGLCISDVIGGLTMWTISSFAIGVTLIITKCFKRKISKDLKKLNNDIDIKEKENEENEKDLDRLKKHITPAHIEYNLKQNNTNEIKTEQCIDNFFVEDTKEETEKKEVEGPTLVKRNKRR